MSKNIGTVSVACVLGSDGLIDVAAFCAEAERVAEAKHAEDGVETAKLRDAVESVWNDNPKLSKATSSLLAQMALMHLKIVPESAEVKVASERIAAFTAGDAETYITVSGKGPNAGTYRRDRLDAETLAKVEKTAAAG